jgi:protein-L-isoaspartate(D-aspartate) O-methyltransferase
VNFAALRDTMVDSQLKPVGVTHAAVLSAMGEVAREDYVPDALRSLAYADLALEVAPGRYLLPPMALGMLLDRAGLSMNDRVLIVGGATGYSAAVCAHAGARVTVLESDPKLAAFARARGLDVAEGPLTGGYPGGAPYTLLVFEGAIEEVPAALTEQLAEGGRLAAIIRDRGVGRATVDIKAEGLMGGLPFADVSAKPLPGFERARAFAF